VKQRDFMRFNVLLGLAVFALLSFPVVAQDSVDEPPHMPAGGTRTHVKGIQVFPVAGRPFSAKDNIKWTHYREDGSTFTTYLFASVARDRQGRIYREHRHLDTGSTLQQFVQEYFVLLDPITHTRTACVSYTHRCEVSAYRASTTFVSTPDRPHDEVAGVFFSESLGNDVIDDLKVVGTRETLSIAAGKIGNAHPLARVREFWYSPELQVNLKVTRGDPTSGTQVLQLVDLSLKEPNPAMFQVPDGFAIQDTRIPVRNEKRSLGIKP
jgi:hypothetical protein